MIALLTGKIAHKAPDYVILDVNGVGYQVFIPFSTYYALPAEGSTATLQIHTSVKEDAINLYGFRTQQEKELFQLLIGVSGVGPKLANGILSNSEPAELSESLVSGNIARLSAIPGIGKKTAERLVLELKEKMKKLGLAPSTPGTAAAPPKPEVREDVLSALINLGYKENVVQKALAELKFPEDATVESGLKLALKKLMK
ncbi:Holliday junction branch migration protein RuvA [Geomonas subterranea]|uniref:Holliday junction branch migration complex subunit RuvA n=1 Tax=Geomonas subterranea TaxID=2847989 RepID=A0ABX8LED8_9BACT|nr:MULTISPECIES: Holliday junction branch migration protein RuvA [Geomonas]QXE89084.1 Holliday junction branch migration protein RuvA [Geomonas subterranea]QXM08799.1 Holliday junction branch migration protein RuvA [Geomonas subterranea]